MLSSKSDSTPTAPALLTGSTNVVEQAREQLYTAWKDVFDKRDIVHIQHQIAALGQAMDDAYYNVNPGVHRPDPQKDGDSVVNDIHLPTQSIHTIRHSLDYWSRAIIWLGKTEVQQAIRTKATSTAIGSPVSPISTAVVPTNANSPAANQPPPDILTRELAHDLRVALIQQSDAWRSLMTYEQNLGNFTAETVTLNILNDFMVKLEKATSKRFSITPLLVGIGVFVLLFIVVVIVIPLIQSSAAPTNPPSAMPINQPSAIIIIIGTVLAGGGHAVMNWVSRLRGVLGTSGQAISDTLQRGYQQILVELGYLNYNMAISNALAVFFIEDAIWLWNWPFSLQIVVDDAYSFLTEIVWTEQDREEEIDRVANAAFGPLGVFLGTQLSTSAQMAAKKNKKK